MDRRLGGGPGPPPAPPPDWFPDPVKGSGERFWDGHAWTPWVEAAPVTAGRGRRFHGRFWGGWVWIARGAIAVLALGGLAFYATGAVHVMALTSFLAMAGICWAFYRFVARQLALRRRRRPRAAVRQRR